MIKSAEIYYKYLFINFHETSTIVVSYTPKCNLYKKLEEDFEGSDAYLYDYHHLSWWEDFES